MNKKQPSLLSTGSFSRICELTELGKYWGNRCGHWYRVKVTSLPKGGGTGGLIYAPIDKRGYPYHQSAALFDCAVVWGPVSAWGNTPPKISKKDLVAAGVSEFWLRPKTDDS